MEFPKISNVKRRSLFMVPSVTFKWDFIKCIFFNPICCHHRRHLNTGLTFGLFKTAWLKIHYLAVWRIFNLFEYDEKHFFLTKNTKNFCGNPAGFPWGDERQLSHESVVLIQDIESPKLWSPSPGIQERNAVLGRLATMLDWGGHLLWQ